jgi:dihydrofolate synthase/folylpolyglutamate synthase
MDCRRARAGLVNFLFPVSPSLTWLYSVQQFGIKPGLANTRRLLREMALPGARQRFLHVAGTNGKGSVCAFMESILRAAGERTGLFTSPHLVSFCERMRCGGRMISPEEVDRGLESLRGVVGGWDPHPTFFELALMLALDWLDREGAETVVLETGMGGRLDATNALTPVVSVITPIGMDHQQWLGDTLREIAVEKAGIIKPGVPVVSAPQVPEVEQVIREAAAQAGAALTFIREPWAEPVSLPGDHQRWNAALAVAAIRAAGIRVTAEATAEGLATTEWPARFQVLDGGRLVIEGAHNPHGTAAALATWRDRFGGEKATVIFGAVAAKDYTASLALLGSVAARFFFVTLQSPRAVPAEALAGEAPPGVEASVFPTVEEAMHAADALKERCLVCGSLYLCGEVLALRGNEPFETSGQ